MATNINSLAATKKHIFSTLEKNTFLGILAKYRDIIENKQTDGATLRLRNTAWKRITNEYNSSSNVTKQVTLIQMKRLWLNLKQRQREALTKGRRHPLISGAAPSTIAHIDHIDPDVMMLTPELIISVDNPVDLDTTAEFQQTPNHIPLTDSVESPATSPLQSPQSVQSPSPTGHSSVSSISPQVNVSTIKPDPDPTALPAPPRPTSPPRPSQHEASFKFNQKLKRHCCDPHECDVSERYASRREKFQAEIHELEKLLLVEKIREARAKADLAELLYRRQTLHNHLH